MKNRYVDAWRQLPESCCVKWGAQAGTREFKRDIDHMWIEATTSNVCFAPTKRKAKLAAIEAAKQKGVWE